MGKRTEPAPDYPFPFCLSRASGNPEKMQLPRYEGDPACLSGGKDIFTEANRYGRFYIGIGGVLTFRNARLAEVVKETNLNQIVLETDAPWLAPEPFRGKRNESAYLVHIVEKLAEIKNTDKKQIVAVTTQNALSLFFSKSL